MKLAAGHGHVEMGKYLYDKMLCSVEKNFGRFNIIVSIGLYFFTHQASLIAADEI